MITSNTSKGPGDASRRGHVAYRPPFPPRGRLFGTSGGPRAYTYAVKRLHRRLTAWCALLAHLLRADRDGGPRLYARRGCLESSCRRSPECRVRAPTWAWRMRKNGRCCASSTARRACNWSITTHRRRRRCARSGPAHPGDGFGCGRSSQSRTNPSLPRLPPHLYSPRAVA